MNQLAVRVRILNEQAKPYMKSLQPENQLIQQQLSALNKEFNQWVKNSLHFKYYFIIYQRIVHPVLLLF